MYTRRRSSSSALLRRILQTNASLRRYADRGSVRELFGGRRVAVTFRTAFRRPAWLRFEFQSPHPYKPLASSISRSVVGSDSLGPYFWSSHYGNSPTLEREESLLMAVAGATGISRGSAHNIATLLLPHTGPSTLSRLRRVRTLPSCVVGGTYCIGISGQHPVGGQVRAYFGARDLLLRKVLHRQLKHLELRRPCRRLGPHAPSAFNPPHEA
jgi:hypothetical protein